MFRTFFTLVLFISLANMVMANDKKSYSQEFILAPKDIHYSYHVWGKKYHVMRSSKNYEEKGIASWYGPQFHRRWTSSGERFNMYKLTAAHKSLPLSTYVLVTNLRNGRKVVVKVNDRGPFISNRIIDLSYAAAKKIGMVGLGLARVKVTALPQA